MPANSLCQDEAGFPAMNQKEIQELLDLLIEKDIAEFELEHDGVRLRVKRSAAAAPVVASAPAPLPLAAPPVAAAAPAATAPPIAASPALVEDEPGIFLVCSPIVGTFFEASSPGAPPFVKQGDKVALGQVLCVVEAMKLMNEIEAEAAGVIAEILVASGQPVEYGQPLFKIRTR